MFHLFFIAGYTMKIKNEAAWLFFCQDCEVLCLRDVKAQLQQLFAKKNILPDVCAICNKSTSPKQSNDARIGSQGTQSKDKHSPKPSSTIKVSTPATRRKAVPEHFDAEKADCRSKRQRTSEGSTNNRSQGDAQHEEQSDDVIGVSNFDSQSRGGGAGVEASSEDTSGPSGFDVSGTKVDINWKASQHQKSELKSKNRDLPRKATRLSTGAIAARQYKLKTNDSDEEENGMTSDGQDDDVDANDDDDYVDSQSDSNVEEVESDDVDDKKQTLVNTERKEESAIKQLPSPHDKKLPSPHGTEGVNPDILAFTTPSDDPRRPFKCKLCIKMYFPYLSTFQLHIKTHNGKEPMEKPFKCDVCDKDYKKFTLLNIHKVVHTDRSDKFKCTYRNCKFMYSNKRDLRCHVEVHSGIKRHKCKTCVLGFAMKRRLEIHQTIHSEDRTFVCDICDSTFSHHRLLKEHRYRHLNQDKYKCDECDYTCRESYGMMAHKERHDKKRGCHFECDRCKQVYASQRFLEKHLESNNCKPPKPPATAKKHSDIGYEDIDISSITKWLNPKILDMMDRPRSSSSPFKCKLCPAAREFKKVSSFLKHMTLTHSEEHVVDLPYTCDTCHKQFTQFDRLKTHLAAHSDERRYSCPECGNRYKTPGHLATHRTIHRVPEQMCSICAKCFTTTSKLKSHIDRVHKKLRPCKCDRCERSFSDKGKLKGHIKRMHENNRPWVCESCGKRFKVKDDLIVHTKLHQEKKFACDECDYRCARAEYLKKHRRTHTGEKPYHCEACEMRFSNRTSLVLHQKKVHGGVLKPSVTSTAKSEGTAEGTMHLGQTHGNSVLVPLPTKPAVTSSHSVEASSVLASGDETRNAIESIDMIHFAHMQGAFSM